MTARGLLALTVLAACAKVDGAPAPPGGLPVLALTLAAGDTARGGFTYTAGPRAAGALVTVRATSFPAGPWTGFPSALPSAAGGAVSFVGTNATADSADLTPCVTWTNSAGSSPEVCGAARRWRRPPGAGGVTWDSLRSALFLKPPAVTLQVATYVNAAQPVDSPTCVRTPRTPGQRWSRGTQGPGVCLLPSGEQVFPFLQDSVVLLAGQRLVRLDTLGHYGQQASLVADSVP